MSVYMKIVIVFIFSLINIFFMGLYTSIERIKKNIQILKKGGK